MDICAWPENLANNIEKKAGKEVRDYVMRGHKKLKSMDGAAKARWVRGAMQRMREKIPDDATRHFILSECSCRLPQEDIEKLRREYKKLNDIDKLINYLHGKVFINKPERKGDIIYITKAPFFPKEYAKAKTHADKRKYFCHCPYVRETEKEVPLEYCHCGAGWCRHIWEGILERPVKVEIVKSVMDGDDVCQFAVHI